MRVQSSFAVILAGGVLASACGAEKSTEAPVVVMTQDLGIGADLDAVLAGSVADLPALVDEMWAQKDRSSFAVRAEAIAAGIASYRPNLVGLQSVIQWRREVPASAAPADEIVLDYLDVLRAALAARGLSYDPVSVVTTADIELTGASGNDYRLTDREVILASSGLKTFGATGGTYAARRTISLGGSTIESRRGWASVLVDRAGKVFRFASTRLEEIDGAVQREQSLELRDVLAQDPVAIVVGDLGSNIQRPSSPGYDVLLARGRLEDAVGRAGAAFPSCCRDAVCADPAARLDSRTDFVLTTRQFRASWGSWVHGNDSGMAGGLWPSSHAGVVAGLWVD